MIRAGEFGFEIDREPPTEAEIKGKIKRLKPQLLLWGFLLTAVLTAILVLLFINFFPLVTQSPIILFLWGGSAAILAAVAVRIVMQVFFRPLSLLSPLPTEMEEKAFKLCQQNIKCDQYRLSVIKQGVH